MACRMQGMRSLSEVLVLVRVIEPVEEEVVGEKRGSAERCRHLGSLEPWIRCDIEWTVTRGAGDSGDLRRMQYLVLCHSAEWWALHVAWSDFIRRVSELQAFMLHPGALQHFWFDL